MRIRKAFFCYISLISLATSFLQGKEVVVDSVIAVPPVIKQASVPMYKFSSGESEIIHKFLMDLESGKSIKLLIHLSPKQNVINKSTPVKVEIVNTTLFTGKKDLDEHNNKTYKICSTAKLLGNPFISDVSPSKKGTAVTVFVPLYQVIEQSFMAKEGARSEAKNYEILDRVTVVLP